MKYLLLMAWLLFIQCRTNQEQTHRPEAQEEQKTGEATVAVPEEVDGGAGEVTLPANTIDYDTSQWTELVRLDSTIRLDLRYATENNFVEEQLYDCGRCFLRPEVALAVSMAHRKLQENGLGLKMYDCYRPRPVQWKLWNKIPDPRYVADPRKGSMHNRGMAVDLTIVDHTGMELDMGTDFDYFGREAYHSYAGHTDEVAENRQLLLETLEDQGFRSTSTEWWHYSFKPKTFPIDDWLWNCD